MPDDKPIDTDGVMADIMKELTGESDHGEHEIEIEEIQDILENQFASEEDTEEAPVIKQIVTETRPTGKEATYKE